MSSEIEKLFDQIQTFTDIRDWSQFHTPKNLVLAVVGEMGELAELLQWKNNLEIKEYLNTTEGKNRFAEEIADVAIYLIRLCQVTNINFLDAIKNKIEINEVKYPVKISKGNSEKYTKLKYD
jgi:dCTP diphosphatase